MRAFRFHGRGRPFELEDVPTPRAEENDVLVRVKAAGICGSDLHYVHGRSTLPRLPAILGHEVAGLVEATGGNVRNVVNGDRVVIHYVVSCGDCVQCNGGRDNACSNYKAIGHHLDGGFAEYISVPSRNVFRLPQEISFAEGAIIGCGVSTPFHALREANLQPGESVAVYGVGGVGMHAIRWAKAFGAGIIVAVDVDRYKLNLATEAGATHAINAKEADPVEVIRGITQEGVNVALECVGLEGTIGQMIESIASCGRAVLVGVLQGKMPVDVLYLLSKRATLIASGDHTRNDLRYVIELVKEKRIDLSRSISHRIPFQRLNEGIEILDQKKENVMRVVLVS